MVNTDKKIVQATHRTAEQNRPLILVVDDEALQLETICRGLKLLGLNCLSATNGYEALEVLAEDQQEISLLITDVTMPGITGDVLVQKLRVLYPKLPLIVMTGLAGDQELNIVHKLGIPILKKPFCPSQLLHAISSQIDLIS